MKLSSMPQSFRECVAFACGMVPTPLMDTLVGLLLAKTIIAATTIGIFDALMVNGAPQPRLAGVACMGRNGKVGVDPIENTVYVPTRQYPVDSTSPTTGSPGVQVYRDLTPPVQPLLTSATAILKPLTGSSAGQVTVTMTPDARVLRISAYPTGVKGSTVLISLPTTVTNEVVPCAADPCE